jgi:serine/threonine protein kinase
MVKGCKRLTRKNKSKKAKAKAKGGKYIYAGSYGCVFSPAILCKGDATRKNGYISKIMKAEDAIAERKEAEILKRLDNAYEYFLYPDRICEPIADKSNAPENCKLKFSKAPVALMSPFGGVDLRKIQVPFQEIPALFEGMVNIFDGLELLHANNLIHNDIKPHNIVALKRDDGSYQVRLIDFGLMHTVDNYLKGEWFHNYPYYPYDVRLLSENYFPKTEDIEEFYLQQEYNQFPMWFYARNDGQQLITKKWVMAMWKKMKGDEARHHVVLELDVFSLGRTLYELYFRLTGQFYVMGDDEGEVLGQGTAGIKKDVALPLFKLIQKMCNPDPFERVSLLEAKAEFVALLPAIKKAFTPVVVPAANKGVMV